MVLLIFRWRGTTHILPYPRGAVEARAVPHLESMNGKKVGPSVPVPEREYAYSQEACRAAFPVGPHRVNRPRVVRTLRVLQTGPSGDGWGGGPGCHFRGHRV